MISAWKVGALRSGNVHSCFPQKIPVLEIFGKLCPPEIGVLGFFSNLAPTIFFKTAMLLEVDIAIILLKIVYPGKIFYSSYGPLLPFQGVKMNFFEFKKYFPLLDFTNFCIKVDLKIIYHSAKTAYPRKSWFSSQGGLKFSDRG